MSAFHYVFKPFFFHSQQGGCEIALISLRGCNSENEWGGAAVGSGGISGRQGGYSPPPSEYASSPL